MDIVTLFYEFLLLYEILKHLGSIAMVCDFHLLFLMIIYIYISVSHGTMIISFWGVAILTY